MSKHYDFKAIAGKNPARELRELSRKLGDCLTETPGANGETLFDGFDLADCGAFEEVARRYAGRTGKDDGIHYIRKGEEPEDGIVELTNGLTEAMLCVTIEPVCFVEK